MRGLTALFLLTCTPAIGQDWATRDLCHTPPLPVTAEDFAPHSLDDLEARAKTFANPRGRFWKVTHANGQVSHLWGTLHASLPSVLNLPDVAKSEIETARALAVEIDYTYPSRDALLGRYDLPGRFIEAGDPFLPPDPTDLSFLGQDPVDWVFERFDAEGFEDAFMIYSYAGLAEFLLSDPCEDFNSGIIPTQDSLIQTFAHIADADVISLETPDDLITDLATEPETAKAIIALQTAYLKPPENPRNFNASVQLYLEGRLGLMMAWDMAHMQATYGDQGLRYLEVADDYLLSIRNRRFVDRITSELETGGVFVAVGAFHLPGETGLIALLRNDGFEVARIPLPGEAP